MRSPEEARSVADTFRMLVLAAYRTRLKDLEKRHQEARVFILEVRLRPRHNSPRAHLALQSSGLHSQPTERVERDYVSVMRGWLVGWRVKSDCGARDWAARAGFWCTCSCSSKTKRTPKL